MTIQTKKDTLVFQSGVGLVVTLTTSHRNTNLVTEFSKEPLNDGRSDEQTMPEEWKRHETCNLANFHMF